MRTRWGMAAALLALVALVVPPAIAAPESPAASGPLQLVSQQRVSDRVLDLTFTTAALAAPTNVRVILPVGFDPAAATRYPVLYLLHGGAGRYTDWSNEGAIEMTADLPLITVLPDGGRSAWYTDWYNNGLGGTPMWETYHVDQLIPWIDAHLPTVGDRSGRAIAGLSSGGFGAMSYAGRHPDLFVAAAAFSPALDTNTPPVVAGKVIDALAAQDGGGPGSLFGLRETEEVRWRGHNPWDLAPNLGDMFVTVRAGNGMAGGDFGGGGPTDPGGYFLEKATYDMAVSFHARMVALGIPHVWDDYGKGTHSYPYWRRDLARTLPDLMRVFAERRADPSTFSFRAAEPSYDVYGWTVAIDRKVMELSSLDRASASGFTLSGSGAATVVTGALYAPGSPHAVTIGAITRTVISDDAGRLHLDVPLGPSNLVQQQFTPQHASPATKVFTTTVTIAPG